MIQRRKHLSMETTPSALKSNRSETQGWSQSLPTLGCKKQPPSGLKKNLGKDQENGGKAQDANPRLSHNAASRLDCVDIAFAFTRF
jgi:hypothetical protein